jgi:hypothetical protein
VGKPEGKRLLVNQDVGGRIILSGSPRSEVGSGGMDWIEMAQDRDR